MTCDSSACKRKKQNMINKYRAYKDESPAIGNIVTEEQKLKWKTTIQKNFPNGTQEHRKGQSFEKQYGEDKAEKIKNKIKDFRNSYQTGENEPHLGCQHSEETKQTMSEKKVEFLSKGAFDKNYEHPEKNEKINWFEHNSITTKLWWKELSEEEREKVLKKNVEGFFKREGNKILHSSTGYTKHWFLEKDQKYDSSYEQAYYDYLNDEKICWKNNTSIYIPYIKPTDYKKHYYVPDILIFSDTTFSDLTKIVEVKPYEFAFNPNNRVSDYYKITHAKLQALKTYSHENNIGYQVVTEKDIFNEN